MKVKIILLSFFSFFFQYTQAQVSFNARSSTTEARVNQPINLSFIISGSSNIQLDSDIDLPNFTGFRSLGTGQVQNFSNINGKTVVQIGYNVTIVGTKAGTYTIGAAYVEVNGKSYKTQPIKIKIVEDNTQTSTPNTSSTNRNYKQAFLKMEVSNKNPFQNEAIVCELRYYAINNNWLGRLNSINPPQSFKGFAVEKVENPDKDYEQKLLGNYVYYSAVVGKYVLIPNQTGTLEIPSFEGQVLVNSTIFDDELATISSEPISIQVKSLPEPKPKDFNGAVGHFKINVFADKKTAKANESVKVEVELVGNGNLKLIKAPSISVPNEIESYPPKMSQNITTDFNGMSGKIVKEHILVPQYGGNYKLSVEPFSFFDPVSQSYKNINAPTISLEVNGPEKPKNGDESKGSEIHDGTEEPHENYANQAEEVLENLVENKKSPFWIILSSVILCLAAILFFIFRKGKKSDDNIAHKEVENVTQKVETLDQPKIIEVVIPKVPKMDLLQKLEAIKPFLLVKNKEIVLSTYEEVLQKLHFSEELIPQKKSLLSQCQLEKYSPITTEIQLEKLYSEIESLVQNS